MKNIKAIIFDLDGTLIDSMYVWEYVDNEFLRRRGIEVPSDYGYECSHRSFYETALYTIDRFSLSQSPEEIMQEWTDLAIKEYSEKVQLLPFAAEAVRLAKEKGCKTAVCTSLTKELYTPVLKRTGLFDLFDVIVSAAEFGKGKQYPDIYRHTANLLGVSPDSCIMLDDVTASLKAAEEAGLTAIGVYGSNGSQDKAEMEKYSKTVITELKALNDIF